MKRNVVPVSGRHVGGKNESRDRRQHERSEEGRGDELADQASAAIEEGRKGRLHGTGSDTLGLELCR
ncbi:hypothetical protein [Stappia indica]|uniref:Uncharacterized protein n=1 Tax=Stappia indica TaxID=538381 RepID=A0A857C3Q6_9HYPH|nr:hypothetical protein [Stappia indica]QGZ33465.1 hypothetical protein GH266_02460 [Stappia indica]